MQLFVIFLVFAWLVSYLLFSCIQWFVAGSVKAGPIKAETTNNTKTAKARGVGAG
jgi:hypothetical protein